MGTDESGFLLGTEILDGMTEITTLPDGSEVKVRVANVELKTAKNNSDCKFLNFMLEAYEEPSADNIYHALFLPGKDAKTPKDNNKRQNTINNFLEAFDRSLPISLEDLKGAEAYAVLKLIDDAQYGESNKVKLFRPIA